MKKLLVLLLTAALITPALALADSMYSLADTSLAGASAAKVFNIQRAAARIHGMTLPRGKVFSFNDIVGPRTKAAGYQKEMNGRGRLVYGGGVSQLATTLDMALAGFDGNIQFLERHTYGHEFTDHYVPSGDKAVRVEYSGGKNYAFTDNMQAIQIDCWVEGGRLNCLVKAAGDGVIKSPAGASSSIYARLVNFDPDTNTAFFDEFEMLRGEEAVLFLMLQNGLSEEEARAEAAGLAESEFVTKDVSKEQRYFNIETVPFTLLYQPSGEMVTGNEGIPSNIGDFRAIWQLNPSLLRDTHFYRLSLTGEQLTFLEQMYWP